MCEMGTVKDTTDRPRDAKADLDIKGKWTSPTRVELTAKLGADTVHTDTINLNNARTRKDFAREVVARSGGDPRKAARSMAAVEKRLIGIAVEHAEREAADPTKAPGGGV